MSDAQNPMIPGAREPGRLTRFASAATGLRAPAAGEGTLDAATITERQREGGGAPSERRPVRAPFAWRHLTTWLSCLSIVLLASAAGAADLDLYRAFRLGTSTADVIAAAPAAGPFLKTLHERPALLQELRWRPSDGNDRAGHVDSVRAIVFSFVNDRLFKIAVEYDASRTAGLTASDMIASLTPMYGAVSPAARPARRAGYDSLDVVTTVAEWRRSDAVVVLQHTSYTGRFGLAITSPPLEQQALQAEAAASIIDAREAPAREAARIAAREEAARAAAAKTRTTNKAAFEP